MPDMKAPAAPVHPLSELPPSLDEIKSAIHSKRNAAAPGLDGITYVPYKRCPAILPLLVIVFEKIWKSHDIPTDWAKASIQLLPKSDVLTEPSEFRPIALTNTWQDILR